ncbi:MAG: hypothetical protein MZU97_20230 [Bacillus subtilis]|nr:hypothetical protein [Bacillus subtilis]
MNDISYLRQAFRLAKKAKDAFKTIRWKAFFGSLKTRLLPRGTSRAKAH